jgi:hypothetical protein
MTVVRWSSDGNAMMITNEHPENTDAKDVENG